ncbi:putative leader peptide [Micromonospora sp. NPDC000018]|uniref:putative leader peptide n=1 Tax=Micromonospora sp. NPDC000018 TaxID=3154239 RepID=UPI00331BE063
MNAGADVNVANVATPVSLPGRALTGRSARRQHEVMSRRDELLLTARVHVDLVRHASALC